jgi:putative FmdB family regulatory protein
MPSYEYECKKCNLAFTVFKPISEFSKKEPCPCCGRQAIRLLSTPIGFILKGEGFYSNDYPKNK